MWRALSIPGAPSFHSFRACNLNLASLIRYPSVPSPSSDPVVSPSGRSYERTALLEHLKKVGERTAVPNRRLIASLLRTALLRSVQIILATRCIRCTLATSAGPDSVATQRGL